MMKRFYIILWCLIIVSLMGCNPKEASKEPLEVDGLFNELSSYEYNIDQKVIKGINKTGLEVFRKLYENDKSVNILFSPLSLTSALSMLENGASGISQTEIIDVLNLESDGTLNETYNSLINHFNEISNLEKDYTTTVNLSNSFWFKRDNLKIRENYLNTIKENYDGDVYTVDFSDVTTKDTMNAWIEDKTNGLLKDTIKETDAYDISYLINTLYFKGQWTDEFSDYYTKEEEFTLSNMNTVSVQMMHKEDRYKYYESDDVQIICLDYSDASMYVILPRGSLEDFMSRYNQTTIHEFDYQTVDLYFPKFKFSSQNDLKDILKSLGMPSVFNAQTAEFMNMTDSDKVYISKVLQNTTIEVDEEGTEAAAVTVLEMETTEMPVEPEEIPVMNCNKPFMFVIKDKLSGCDLFIGIVQKPLED